MSSDDATLPQEQRASRALPTEFEGRLLAGRYKVGKCIGVGGMGAVYEAEDAKRNRTVAVKVLRGDVRTMVNLRRFRLEAATAMSVRHPNLCAVYDVGHEWGRPFIVMERLVGEPLSTRLRRSGPLSVTDALAITLDLLDVLSAIHARGILHRDVKPSNVFLTNDSTTAPTIKLLDFGVAKRIASPQILRRSEDDTAITGTDLIAGTPSYLTPEQIAGARDLDPRVDVWGAGLTLYEMLSGRRAYPVAEFEQLAREISSEDQLVSGLSATTDAPPELLVALGSALAKDRGRRFATADEFRAALVKSYSRHVVVAIARGRELIKPRRRP